MIGYLHSIPSGDLLTTTTHVTATTSNPYLSGVESESTAKTTTWVTTTNPRLYSADDYCSALTTAGAGTRIGMNNNSLLLQTMPVTRPLMTSIALHPAGCDMRDREST